MSRSPVNSPRITRRWPFWLGFPLLMGVAAAVALLVYQLSDGRKASAPGDAAPAPVVDPVVATINGEPVSAGEYRLVMERKVSLVYSYFKEHQNLDDHLGYWSENTGPDSPLAKLRQMTREELVRIKVYQGQAKAKGLIQDATFATFHSDFERENARRALALAARQVVYGPPQYRETSYYYIRFGDLVFKLKQAMAKEIQPQITDAEVAAFYKENKATLGDKSLADSRPGILTFLSTKAAGKQLDALCASAKVDFNEVLIRPIVPRIDPPQGS